MRTKLEFRLDPSKGYRASTHSSFSSSRFDQNIKIKALFLQTSQYQPRMVKLNMVKQDLALILQTLGQHGYSWDHW